MLEGDLNGSVIEMSEQYGTVPSFWNLKLGIHRFFFSFHPTEEISSPKKRKGEKGKSFKFDVS